MSKKLRKNPSKAAVTKTASRTATPVKKAIAKSGAKSGAKPVGKSGARVAVKAAGKPAGKSVTKTVTEPAAKTTAKSAKPPARMAKKAVVAAPARKAVAKELKPSAVKKAAAPKAVSKPRATKPTTPDTVAPAAQPAAPPAPAVAIEGALAPAFQLPRDGGAPVSLADYSGRKLVIFFYPRANTPGCTREAIDFSRLTAEFKAAGAAILGVSADPLKAQESFRDKHDLVTPLLSDLTHEMLKAYGAWGKKSMYGKTFEGVLRTTVMIGADGCVARIWRNVKVDGHAAAVLEDVNRL
jgi:peroxiredoxin Q/BCP